MYCIVYSWFCRPLNNNNNMNKNESTKIELYSLLASAVCMHKNEENETNGANVCTNKRSEMKVPIENIDVYIHWTKNKKKLFFATPIQAQTAGLRRPNIHIFAHKRELHSSGWTESPKHTLQFNGRLCECERDGQRARMFGLFVRELTAAHSVVSLLYFRCTSNVTQSFLSIRVLF